MYMPAGEDQERPLPAAQLFLVRSGITPPLLHAHAFFLALAYPRPRPSPGLPMAPPTPVLVLGTAPLWGCSAGSPAQSHWPWTCPQVLGAECSTSTPKASPLCYLCKVENKNLRWSRQHKSKTTTIKQRKVLGNDHEGAQRVNTPCTKDTFGSVALTQGRGRPPVTHQVLGGEV